MHSHYIYIYIYIHTHTHTHTRVCVCVCVDINSHSITNPKPIIWLMCPTTYMIPHINARRNIVTRASSARCLTTRRNINGTWMKFERTWLIDWLSCDVFVKFLCKAYVKWNAVDKLTSELMSKARNIPPKLQNPTFMSFIEAAFSCAY